jgi:hypothetical protein
MSQNQSVAGEDAIGVINCYNVSQINNLILTTFSYSIQF